MLHTPSATNPLGIKVRQRSRGTGMESEPADTNAKKAKGQRTAVKLRTKKKHTHRQELFFLVMHFLLSEIHYSANMTHEDN